MALPYYTRLEIDALLENFQPDDNSSPTPNPGGEVLYFDNYSLFPRPGESENLYVDNSDGIIYIWDTGLVDYKEEGRTQIRADWNQTDPNQVSYIRNKPLQEGQLPFVTRWTVGAGETITLPIGTEGINQVRVEWGDDTYNYEHQHTYDVAGTYDISITGRLEDFRFNNNNVSRTKITEVVSWGDLEYKLINFYGCSNLALLVNESPNFLAVNNLYQFLRGTGISNIPEQLFVLAPNVTSLANAFRGTKNLTSIDNNLLTSCFNLSSVYGLLQESSIQQIPEDLFRLNINIRSFSNCFRETPLTSIPPRLFRYSDFAENMFQAFYGVNITDIPTDLFKYAKRIENFEDTFRNIPSLTGTVPDLWNQYPDAIGAGCFGLSTNIANYADIPADWK